MFESDLGTNSTSGLKLPPPASSHLEATRGLPNPSGRPPPDRPIDGRRRPAGERPHPKKLRYTPPRPPSTLVARRRLPELRLQCCQLDRGFPSLDLADSLPLRDPNVQNCGTEVRSEGGEQACLGLDGA